MDLDAEPWPRKIGGTASELASCMDARTEAIVVGTPCILTGRASAGRTAPSTAEDLSLCSIPLLRRSCYILWFTVERVECT